MSSKAELHNTKWILNELRDHTNIDSEQEVFIQFQAEDQKVIGSSGCNNFFGRFELSDGALSISNLGSTKMMCQNMQVEDAFLNYIRNVKRLEVSGTTLSLYDTNGQFAAFTAEPK